MHTRLQEMSFLHTASSNLICKPQENGAFTQQRRQRLRSRAIEAKAHVLHHSTQPWVIGHLSWYVLSTPYCLPDRRGFLTSSHASYAISSPPIDCIAQTCMNRLHTSALCFTTGFQALGSIERHYDHHLQDVTPDIPHSPREYLGSKISRQHSTKNDKFMSDKRAKTNGTYATHAIFYLYKQQYDKSVQAVQTFSERGSEEGITGLVTSAICARQCPMPPCRAYLSRPQIAIE